MQREGTFREMKRHVHYEKPSEKRARQKAEAVRRARKLARKRLQREGLLPAAQAQAEALAASKPARGRLKARPAPGFLRMRRALPILAAKLGSCACARSQEGEAA